MRRSPLSRRTPLARAGRLRAVSARRRRRDAGYPAARAEVFARSGGRCEAGAADDCSGVCEQTHHVRGRTGPNPHYSEWLLGVCHRCHLAIHADPARSYVQGWMRRRLGGDGG